MKTHIIIDFMHIYYKYFFQMQSGRLGKLTYNVDGIGEIETSLIYYSLKDIEGIRKQMEGLGHDVTMSICLDSKSSRKEENEEYKSKRVSRLKEENFNDLAIIEELLRDAGHNVYKIEGYEADDIAASLADNIDNQFDYSIIYTNDKDLLQSVNTKTGVMRFKQSRGYSPVDHINYTDYVSNEMGVYVPYNTIGLYLATVGDSSDNIAGIKRFGKKAFETYIREVISLASKHSIDIRECGKPENLYRIAEVSRVLLSEEQYEQLLESLKMVARISISVDKPASKSTREMRDYSYCKYGMQSLV